MFFSVSFLHMNHHVQSYSIILIISHIRKKNILCFTRTSFFCLFSPYGKDKLSRLWHHSNTSIVKKLWGHALKMHISNFSNIVLLRELNKTGIDMGEIKINPCCVVDTWKSLAFRIDSFFHTSARLIMENKESHSFGWDFQVSFLQGRYRFYKFTEVSHYAL